MKHVSFIKYRDGLFIADAEDIRERVSYLENSDGVPVMASVSLDRDPITPFKWFIDSGYVQCSREEFLQARYKAQAAIVEFFGYQEGYERPVKRNRFRDEE